MGPLRVSWLLVDDVERLAQSPPLDGPPWLVLALALITTVAGIGGPALLKRMDRPAAPVPPQAPPAVEASVDLVAEALADARQERDEAQAEARRCADELADTRVVLAHAEALLDAHNIQRPRPHQPPRGEGSG